MKVWVIMGQQGSWDSHHSWLERICASYETAEIIKGELDKKVEDKLAKALIVRAEIDNPEDMDRFDNMSAEESDLYFYEPEEYDIQEKDVIETI